MEVKAVGVASQVFATIALFNRVATKMPTNCARTTIRMIRLTRERLTIFSRRRLLKGSPLSTCSRK